MHFLYEYYNLNNVGIGLEALDMLKKQIMKFACLCINAYEIFVNCSYIRARIDLKRLQRFYTNFSLYFYKWKLSDATFLYHLLFFKNIFKDFHFVISQLYSMLYDIFLFKPLSQLAHDHKRQNVRATDKIRHKS